jgi:hypothetical protein
MGKSLGTGRLGTKSPRPDNALEAAQAVYDTVMEDVPAVARKALEPLLKDFREEAKGGVAVLVGKAIQEELAGRLDALKKEHARQIKELRALWEEKAAEMRQSHAASLEMVKSLFANLPTPQVTVNVPDKAIEVKALPANVQVTIPDKAIEIKTLPSVVNFSVPKDALEVKLLPSTVNFSVPKDAIQIKQLPTVVNLPKDAVEVKLLPAPASVVNVAAPNVTLPEGAIQVKTLVDLPRRKTKTEKSILYDRETGRPSKILEETEES